MTTEYPKDDDAIRARDIVQHWLVALLESKAHKNLIIRFNTPTHYHVERISGGLSNILFKVRYVQIEDLSEAGTDLPESIHPIFTQGVGVRFYSDIPQSTGSIFVNRIQEEKIVSYLSERDLSKQIFHRFNGGQIEEWRAGRVISLEEMKDSLISHKIATRLGEVHSLDIYPLLDMNGIVSSQLWNRIWIWYDEVVKNRELLQSFIDIDYIQSVAHHLQNMNKLASSKFVLCHCDLLSGNIVLSDEHEPNSMSSTPPPQRHQEPGSEIHFIDYEYACIAERGFDIANHFCEMAGFECDYSKLPDLQFRQTFYKVYLQSLNSSSNYKSSRTPYSMRRDGSSLTTKSTVDGEDEDEEKSSEEPQSTTTTSNHQLFYPTQSNTNTVKGESTPTSADQYHDSEDLILNQIDKEVQSFMSTTHLLWGLWSALKYLHYEYEVKSTPPLNYRTYACLRLSRMKEELKTSTL